MTNSYKKKFKKVDPKLLGTGNNTFPIRTMKCKGTNKRITLKFNGAKTL